MSQHFITTVINYCTNDYRFIKKCISEALVFSNQVLVPVCDHFFDGSKENRKLLNLTYFENPEAEFIEYKYYKNKLYYPYITSQDPIKKQHLLHSTSRYISYFFLKKETEYILFLDADEILEGANFKRWLDESDYRNFSAIRLGAYDYFRSSNLRIKYINFIGLLVAQKKLSPLLLMEEGERFATFNFMEGRKNQKGLFKKRPMIHHYSWVRTKKEMLKKTGTWGHFKDKDWKGLIEREFSKENSERDFYNIKLVKTPIYFDPLKVIPDLRRKRRGLLKNVYKTDRFDILKKQI